jgi:DNA-binding GntR family transcriptional regulator
MRYAEYGIQEVYGRKPAMEELKTIRKNTTLSEKAYEVIKEAIILNKIKPGEILAEEPLAERLGISRTPIKAALRRMVFERIAKVNEKSNIVVSDVTERDIRDVTVVRTALETLAISLIETVDPGRLAALKSICRRQESAIANQDTRKYIKIDFEFHTQVAGFSGNVFLCDMIQQANLTTNRFLVLSGTLPKYMRVASLEHEKIVDCLEKGDLPGAREAMRIHVSNVDRRMLRR